MNRSRRRIEEPGLRRCGRRGLPRAQLQHLQQARILRPQPRQLRGHSRGNLSHAHTIRSRNREARPTARNPARPGLIDLTSAAVALNRMNRDEFFAKLTDLDEDRIKKALWNLYRRGPAQLRERIESELDPAQDAVRKRAAAAPPDPDIVLWEVRDFAELARAGAYMAGTGASPRRSGHAGA